MALPVVDFPQPDSPTRPRVSPSFTSRLTLDTAWTFNPDRPGPPGGEMKVFMDQLHTWYGGDIHDRAFMVDFFHRHTEAVVAGVPKDRLLVFNVTEGWDPLCAFLEVPVPETPYPRENSTQEFQTRVASGQMPINLEKIARP